MKRRSSQTGSAHVVAIICLVLALITALGWIFWQNFIHKEPAQKDTELLVVDKENDNTDQTKEDSYLSVTEWKVKLPIEGVIADATYHYDKERDTMYFSTKGLDTKSGYPDGKGCEVVALWRGMKGDVKMHDAGDPSVAVAYFSEDDIKVGDYYYASMGGNGLCTDEPEYEGSVRKALLDAIKKLTTD